MNGNGQIDYNGSDRISRSVTDYYTRAEGACRRTRTYVWPETGLDTPTLASTSEALLDGSKSWAITDAGTRRTEITLNAGTGARTVRTYAPDGSYAQETWEYGKLTSSSRCDNSSAPIGGTSYSYDPYGRQAVAADARNGATMLYYNAADMVEATITPSPDGVQAGLATTNVYNSALRLYRTVLPDGGIVNYEYYPTGLRKKTWGSREYPVQYEYDSQGRLTKMKTWQGFAASSGEAVTTWNYQPATGLLLNKRYADGNGPSYEYTPEGRLQTRTWARGTTTGYTYGPAGDLLTVDYSDSTPDLVYAYDRRGRQTGATQGGTVTLSRTYNGLGGVSSERFAGGPLNGLTVTNRFDGYLRRTNVALLNSSQAVLASTGIEFDGASRLYRVSQPSILGSQPVTATYSYVANSALVEQIEFARNGAGVMKTTNHWDKFNRLGAVASEVSGAPVAVHAYQYNPAGQRAAVTNVDNAFWVYTYDSLGQVTSGKKYFQDGTPVAGQQFEYGFDDIGNRKTAAAGGDAAGQNLRQQRYTANLLNQYTERRNPQSFGILGSANADATVTVWGPDGAHAQAIRQGEHFYGEVAVSNYPGPVWLKTTNTAFMYVNDAELWTNTTGKALVPPTPQGYTHDLDGNLTADGLWTRTWNAENRVLTVESVSALPGDAKKREAWTYLPDGRWIERIVSTNNGSGYYPALTNRYVWDGQVLLAILDHANGLVMSFMRGLDLSGSVQGAGGVGGVLAVNFSPSTLNPQPSTHVVCYDGNGNVVGLSDAATGASAARFEYGPFGELQRTTGPMANIMPLRFSTMYADDVTGDLKYLFRDYRTEEGRWCGRDPIAEEGGLNLYLFLANSAIASVDKWGLLQCIPEEEEVDEGTLNPKPDPHWKTLGDCSVSFTPSARGPMSCSCGWKFEFSATCKAKIRYLKPKETTKKLKPNTSGNTVEQHEMTHFRDAVSIYSDIEKEWNAFARKCMSAKCYEATWKYLNAYTAAMYAYKRFVDSSFDANEYRPGKRQEEESQKAANAFSDYQSKIHEAEQLGNAREAVCSGN